MTGTRDSAREWVAICAALGAAANPDATEAEVEQAVNDALDKFDAEHPADLPPALDAERARGAKADEQYMLWREDRNA